MKKSARARARHSGFARKLIRFVTSAREAYERGEVTHVPRNYRQVAKWLTSQGEEAADTTVRDWRNQRCLPDARFIGLLERLMVAPWSYLDDPTTTWPPSDDDVRAFHVAIVSTPSERRRVAAALREAFRGTGPQP